MLLVVTLCGFHRIHVGFHPKMFTWDCEVGQNS